MVQFLSSEEAIGESDVGVPQSDVGFLKSDVGFLRSDVGFPKSDVGPRKPDVGSSGTIQTVSARYSPQRHDTHHFGAIQADV